MKKISLLIIGISLVSFTFAQNYLDALRYSQFFPTGTARNLSVGGAFGTFGGDMSAFYTNPAGLGVYRKSEITITPGYNYLNSAADYYGRSTEDFVHKISLDNIGFVSSINNKSEGLVGISFGVAYNKLKDFNNNIIISGNNEYSSLVDYFMWNANGLSPDYLDGYWEWLAYDGLLMDTVQGTNYEYDTPVFLPVSQRRTITTKGGIGDWSFAFGMNYNNKLYIGGGLSIIRINYSEVSEHYEYDYMFYSDFDDFTFMQELTAKGTGVNFKLGLIARPVEFLRIGASLQTPTWYDIEDVFYTKLYSTFTNNTYTALPMDFDGSMLGELVTEYKLVTPFKSTGSLGFQFGKFGLLSFEAEYINYASMRLREGYDGYSYFDENSEISDYFRDVLNLRTGGEIRLDNIAIRGGFAYYPSPYEKGELNEKSGNTSITAGIGFRDKNFFIDLGSAYMMHNEKYNLYPDPGGDNISDLKLNNLRLLATIGFRF
ncbi:MAG: hypothetical protein JXB00_15485 [Bacteroidales bacterium]|nr:hypothetical protein [Bacteroidales bacterium]